LLAQSISREEYNQKELAFEISVTRNTFKQILTEALDMGIAELDDDNCVSVTEHFFQIYKLSYINEWRLIGSESAGLLSKAFDSLSTRTIPLSVEEAIDKTFELLILSRAESVKQDRKLKVELYSRPKEKNLSSWVISNTFNRDLLLLLMSASISGDMINITQIMRRLNVSRNSAKQSLFSGMGSGFVKKSTSGFCFTDEALNAYIVWHEEVFKSYSDELLSAFAIFHSQLAIDK
jgi:predicted transcriptional regulator